MVISKRRGIGLILAVVTLLLTALLSGCGPHICEDTPLSHQKGCDDGSGGVNIPPPTSGGNSG